MIPAIVKGVYEAHTNYLKEDNPYILIPTDVEIYLRDGAVTVEYEGVEYTEKDMGED